MARHDATPFHGRALHGNRLISAVDRDPNHLHYLTLLLHRMGYRVEAAATDAAARRSIGKQVPDLVVAHFPLVGDNDLAFLQELRVNQRTAAVPVIVITSSGDLVGAKDCLAAGAAECIAWPVEAEELYFSVQKALERVPRRNLRMLLRLPVYVNSDPLECSANGCETVLSAKGMYVETRYPAAEREKLTVQFMLGDRPVSVDATVLFSDYPGPALGRETGMGLYFTKIAPEDEAFIRQYIHNAISSGEPGGKVGLGTKR